MYDVEIEGFAHCKAIESCGLLLKGIRDHKMIKRTGTLIGTAASAQAKKKPRLRELILSSYLFTHG